MITFVFDYKKKPLLEYVYINETYTYKFKRNALLLGTR